MNSITITIPLPPRELSPNARVHWAKKARAARAYRMTSAFKAIKASGRCGEKWEKASVKIVAHFKTRRHPDPDNFIASLKAAFDGLADAGVVENDRGLWPERPEFYADKENPRVELTITEES